MSKPHQWDTSKGRKFVVVSFWGVETTVEFFGNEADAERRYEKDAESGADVLFAKTKRMQKADES